MLRHRLIIAATLVAALALGWLVTGRVFQIAFEDLGPSVYPAGHWIQERIEALFPSVQRVMVAPVFMIGSVLAIGVAAFFAARASARRATGVDGARRRLLGSAAVGTASLLLAFLGGVGRSLFGIGEGGRAWAPVWGKIFNDAPTLHPEWKDEWREARVRAHRRLGRTGWQVSDIVLGASDVTGEQGEAVVRLALERGVNYVDTAPDYSAEGSERAVGNALQGRRESVFLATKFCTPRGNLPAGTAAEGYVSAVEASLRRLRTDYVDLVHVHGCDSLERLLDPNLHEAMERLRAAGKARFLGFSSHTPNLVEVAETAIADGRFDVMMLAYHHGIWPRIGEVIARARSEADMGVVAMKTLKGAKHRGLEDFAAYADAYSQAALKWTLSNPDVSAAIISFGVPQQVDEYLHASGQQLSDADIAALGSYDARIAGTYCAPHCGDCLQACPEQVPIPDVLRQRMYFEDYGREKEAMRLYAALERNAAACAGCSAPCTRACPIGVRIPERTAGAHELLTLS